MWKSISHWSVLASTLVTLGCVIPQVSAKTITYQIVTNEISAKDPDGSKTEVYRFDPAIYPVFQGDDVVLQIYGVKGHDHPILLEGYNIRGVIHRHQLTTLRFHADKLGVFRLICLAHPDMAHHGPMEAYVIVSKK
jgi:hypothetical protein